MAEARNFVALQDKLFELAKQPTEALKPQIESRKDVAKTLISLSSAALLFTITFASSLIKANSGVSLRYTIGACWLAFVLSLALSLSSLWFSVGLHNFPALLMTKTKEINEIAASNRANLPDFVANLWQNEIVPDDRRSRRFLLAGFISYALALVILLIVGVWQFILWCRTAAEQFAGRERRGASPNPDSSGCGGGCFDLRRHINQPFGLC